MCRELPDAAQYKLAALRKLTGLSVPIPLKNSVIKRPLSES
jgi:hypothetical protein